MAIGLPRFADRPNEPANGNGYRKGFGMTLPSYPSNGAFRGPGEQVGPGIPHPRNAQYASQFAAMDSNRKYRDQYDSQRQQSMMQNHQNNMNTYASMGAPPSPYMQGLQQHAGDVARGLAPAIGRGSQNLSSFGQGLLRAQAAGLPPTQPGGQGSFMQNPVPKPEMIPVRPGSSQQVYGLTRMNGDAPRYTDGAQIMVHPEDERNTHSIAVSRTPTGGLLLKGNKVVTQDQNAPGFKEYQARIAAKKQSAADSRVLANAQRYGLSPNLPAVRAALMRMQGGYGPANGGLPRPLPMENGVAMVPNMGAMNPFGFPGNVIPRQEDNVDPSLVNPPSVKMLPPNTRRNRPITGHGVPDQF